MNTTTAGIAFVAALVITLALVHVPLGDYMYRVYSSDKHSRAERLIYRAIGAKPEVEQTWPIYARSVLAFSAVSILFLFFFQLAQGALPLHLNVPLPRRRGRSRRREDVPADGVADLIRR
ncbi:potassium-transporting ATPase subunit KdpA, partial [Gordonia aichiensis]